VRIAVISFLTPADDDPKTPLGELMLAGTTIAARQLELAVELGCERLVCVAAGLDRAQIDIQHRTEAVGLKFNLISGPRPLINMVKPGDEIVVVGEGLLPDLEFATKVLGSGKAIAVLPVEAGIAAGFERIDLNHAWAGVLVMPGRLVERLGELPSDCDTISALLRIALQGRVAERILPDAALSDGRWSLVQSREQLAGLEPEWFKRRAASASPFAPGRALARLGMGRFGRGLLASGIKPELVTAIGIAIAAMGVAAAWFDQAIAAFVVCGLGWLVIEAADALAQFSLTETKKDERYGKLARLTHWLVDIYFLAILLLLVPGDWQERLAGPVLLMGLINLAERQITVKWAEFLQDRAILATILAVSAGFGVLVPTMEVLAVLLLGALLAETGRQSRITQA
jgi:hypothetical protein